MFSCGKQGQGDLQVENAVFRREGIKAAVLGHDGTDAAAATAVARFGGHRQALLQEQQLIIGAAKR